MKREIRKSLQLKSKNLMKLMNQYSDRKPIVDFLDEQSNFSYQITIPCHHKNYTPLTFSKKIKDFISLLEHFVFTKKERRNNFKLEVYPTFENKSHIHILINRPDCKKLNELKFDYKIDEFMKDKVIRVIKKLNIFNDYSYNIPDPLYHLKKIDPLFKNTFKKIYEPFICLNYNTKEYTNNTKRYKNNHQLFSTIDFSNLQLNPTL